MVMTDKKSNKSSLVANLMLLIAVLLVSIFLAEFVIRKLYKDTTVLFPRYHTSANYGEFTIRKIRPNSNFTHTSVDGTWHFSTNAQGFRNYVDFDYEKPFGKYRVVSIGDSHTQGYECHQDYTYSKVIENYLNKAGFEAEVLNTGVSGFSTAEALVLLEQELVKYKPDVVVLGFFANDYVDNLKSGLYELDSNNTLIVSKKEHIPGVRIQDVIYALPGIKWLSENSYLYSILFNNTWRYFKKKLRDTEKNKALQNKADKDTGSQEELAVATKTNYSSYEISLAAALIERIYKVSRKIGAIFIVVDIPRVDKQNSILPSLVNELLPSVMRNSDGIVPHEVLLPYKDVARIHLRHGHRHISEFTHSILGVEAAKQILKIENTK